MVISRFYTDTPIQGTEVQSPQLLQSKTKTKGGDSTKKNVFRKENKTKNSFKKEYKYNTESENSKKKLMLLLLVCTFTPREKRKRGFERQKKEEKREETKKKKGEMAINVNGQEKKEQNFNLFSKRNTGEAQLRQCAKKKRVKHNVKRKSKIKKRRQSYFFFSFFLLSKE